MNSDLRIRICVPGERDMHYMKTNCFKLILYFSFLILFCGKALAINENVLTDPQNFDSDLVLTSIPMKLLSSGISDSVKWLPENIPGALWFSLNPGEGDPNNYTDSLRSNTPGKIIFNPANLPIGYLYCLISSHDAQLTSMEFPLVHESPISVTMIYPQSDVNAIAGIQTTTPVFQWEPNPGVPFYHLLLSDQPFEIETDPVTGAVSTTGANIIWQVITASTSIIYGTPDPSNSLNVTNYPPLVGDLTGQNRPTYNWVMINNYGNEPAYSSEVVGELMAFEIQVQPPFDPPVLISPGTIDPEDTLLYDETIMFEWTSIPQAFNYHLYLNKQEYSFDSTSIVYNPVWYTQSTLNAVECPAVNLLINGKYRWIVIAEDNQGEGAISEPLVFSYYQDTGHAEFNVRSTGNQPVLGVQIDFIPIEGPNIPYIATNTSGFAERVMPYGTYVLELSKNGYVTTQTDELVISSPGTITNYYQIYMAQSSAFGTVVDNSGSLVFDAVVTATNTLTNDVVTAQTNSSGYFSFNIEPGTWTFVAGKSGYTSSAPKTAVLLPEDNIDLDGFGGPMVMNVNLYTLDGYIVNDFGEPISLAAVTCTSGPQTYEDITSDNGVYSIEVASGLWTLTAEKPAFWVSTTLEPLLVINSGYTTNIELTPSANIVSGNVFEGAVLSQGNALVRAIPGAGQIEEVQVNQQGGFILSLSTGNYNLNAYLEGFSSPPPINLSLNVGETISGVNIALTPNPSYISGKVTYNGVQGVDSAVVSASGVTTYTNSQGNYTLNLPAGPHVVSASKSGYIGASSPQVNLAVAQTLPNVNLIITPNAATINGSVTSGGQPVYQANMTARKVSTNTISQIQTQTNGSYSFSLSYGNYWIKGAKSGFVTAAPESLNVSINPGQTVNNINFTFVPNVGYISGRAMNNNQGVSNTQVNLVALDNASLTFNTQTTFFGTFNITVTPGHAYKITASKTGYISAIDTSEVVLIESAQDFTLNLSQLPSSLVGKVFALPNNTTLNTATVTAVKQGGGTYTATTNNVGTYNLNMEAGVYTITASKSGYLSAQRDTTLSSGQNLTNFHFYLQPNFAGLTGFIRRVSDNQPIMNVLVTATEVNTSTGSSAQTDNTGNYSFEQLPQGSYNIVCSHPQFQGTQLNGLVLLGGNTTTQNFTMLALDGSISGNIIDFFGNPVNEAIVTAESPVNSYSTQSGADGTYVISNLPAATYSISASKQGFTVTDTSGVVLTANQQLTDMDFRIVRNDGIVIGRVINTEGLGVNAAQVSASDGFGNFGNTTSSPSGYYTIMELNSISNFTVNVTKSGYTNFSGPVQIVPSPTPTDSANFTLLANNLSIAGTVTNQVGTQKGNINVIAVNGSTTLTNSTNSSGDYTITSAANQTEYYVATNSYSLALNNANLDTMVGIVNLTDIDLVIQEHSASIAGLVTDSSGNAMVNVPMKIKRIGGSLFSTTTNISGAYLQQYLFAGDFKIYPSKLGYSAEPDTHFISVNLGEQVTSMDFVLSQIMIDLSGTVVDDLGNPMNNVPVVAWSTVATDTEYTVADGSFIFADMTPNVTYQISTVLPSEEYENDLVEVQAGMSNISGIALEVNVHNAAVEGWVIESGGGGLAGAIVTLTGVAPLNYEESITTSDSLFNFFYLHSGDYTLNITSSGYLDHDQNIALNASQQLNLGAVSLNPLTSALYGTITNGSTSNPIKNVVVTITNVNTSDTLSNITNASGLYQISDLNVVPPDNVYTIKMVKAGFPDSTSAPIILWQSTQKDYTLLAFTNSIYGAVNNQAGVGQQNAIVRAEQFGGAVSYDTTNYFGDYYLSPLSSGNYQVNAVAGTLDSYFENANLAANGRTKIDLTVLNTAKIFGTVTYEGATPPGQASVTALNTLNQNVLTYQTTADDSSFFFSGLRASFYSVSASIPGFDVLNSPQTVATTLGVTDTLNFILEAESNAIMGFVKDSTGLNPVHLAAVKLHNIAGPDTFTVQTSANGSYSFQNLVGGDYSLWVTKSGYLSTTMSNATVSLSDNQPVNRNLWLKSIPSSISGTARNILTGAGLSNVDVNLMLNDGAYDSTIVTGSTGEYLFAELPIGNYVIKASKTLYTVQPDSIAGALAPDQSISGKDFYLTAEVDSFDVTGNVSHGLDALDSARVILRSLTSGSRDTVYTNTQGFYSYLNVPAPDQFQIRVSKPEYPALVSEPFDLDTGDVVKDFDYPSGQIKLFLTLNGETPLGNTPVTIYNSAQNIDTTITAGADGWISTAELLVGDDVDPVEYLITVVNYISGIVPLQAFFLSLHNDEILIDTVITGVEFSGPDSAQVGIPFTIQAEIANEIINSALNLNVSLFYKGVGRSSFEEMIMLPSGVFENVPGTGGGDYNRPDGLSLVKTGGQSATQIPDITAVSSANSASGKSKSENIQGSNVVPLNSGISPSPPEKVFETGSTTYSAEVPYQSSSGNLEYYIKVTADDRVYSNFNNKKTVKISSIGVLALVQIQPGSKSLQFGASQLLEIQAFDDAFNQLNDSLTVDDVIWSHWDVQDTSSTLGTLQQIYSPTAQDSAALSAVFFTADSGIAKVKAQISHSTVTLASIIQLDIENKVLGTLNISANINGFEISNTDSVTFTANAYDIEQTPMYINPQWTVDPPEIGQLIILNNGKAKLKPYPGMVGQTFITVRDSITGAAASFNALSTNLDDRGLFIGQFMPANADTDIVLMDESGFSLSIPPGSFETNAMVFLKRPPLSQVRKNTVKYEVHMDSYNLLTNGNFSNSMVNGDISMTLTLPVPEETKRLNTIIGRWNKFEVQWDEYESGLSSDGNSISAAIHGFSEYAVLGQSKPLGIENLEFHPNPFSPHTGKKLQMEFVLNSNIDPSPQVTIKIFNMRGDLVRTLLENTPVPKGPHYYNFGEVFQNGSENGSVEWDGYTNNGLIARNGRYVVHIQVKDPSGEKDKLESVVLIK